MNLAQCPPKTKARLTGLAVDPQFTLRMHELGLRPGAEFTVITRAAFGGFIINLSGTRVAVDRLSARQLEVEMVQ